MILVPPGKFLMGSPEHEIGRHENETAHQVELGRGFAIARTEVTQGQYRSVMGLNPMELVETCQKKGISDANPVVCVSWYDALRYCNRLSELEGLEPAYAVDGDEVVWNREAGGYRLPTEAEWEYAARAGSRDRYAGTDDDAQVIRYANVGDATLLEFDPDREGAMFPGRDGYAFLAPAGSFLPNAWGLHDMTGNAWEWVWDWYGLYWESVDPAGSHDGTDRVYRGGGWPSQPRGEVHWIWGSPRVSSRGWLSPHGKNVSVGFRVARNAP